MVPGDFAGTAAVPRKLIAESITYWYTGDHLSLRCNMCNLHRDHLNRRIM